MESWRNSPWLFAVTLAGVLGITLTGTALRRQKPMSTPAAATLERTSEHIGLRAAPDGDALELQWDRRSRPILNADRATLHIQDGKYQSQLDLTDQQLSGARVRYWPETKDVTFRMEVYHGNASTSDTVQIAVAGPVRAPVGGVAASAVEKAGPSLFVRARPRIVRAPPVRRAPPVIPVVTGSKRAEAVHNEPARPAGKYRESGFSRVVSKIPLLRRLKKRPQSGDSERSADSNFRP